MSTPALSIVMPIYNASETLDEAMRSIIAQTRHDWELIAWDDGSTDDSFARLQRYSAMDPRIRAMQAPHQGIVKALRQACAAAQAPLLARMDADDIALPERLELQARLFENEPELVLCGARVSLFGEGIGPGLRRYETWINSLTNHDDIMRDLFVECPIPHPTFMCRRNAFEAIGGYRDCSWPEDYDLVMRVCLANGRFAKPEPTLLRWRNRQGRLSMTDERYGDRAFRALKRHYIDLAFDAHRDKIRIQWGAGEVGKRWLREWPTPPAAVVDIHPRKIGRRIHGVRVIAPDMLPAPGSCFILVAVGARDARTDIRKWFAAHDYREMTDYLFVA